MYNSNKYSRRKERDEITITNPAIHSYMLKDHFGETNHGMIKFFKTHEYKKLMLLDPKTIDKSKIKNMKEEYKKEKDLDCSYKDFAINLDPWKNVSNLLIRDRNKGERFCW